MICNPTVLDSGYDDESNLETIIYKHWYKFI